MKRVAECNPYLSEPLALCPGQYKGTSGSLDTEAAKTTAILPELRTGQVTGATYHRYQAQSPSQLPAHTI